jgi:hypothetical protein
MAFTLFGSSRIHLALDLRGDSVGVEFIRKEAAGNIVSLAKTTLGVQLGTATEIPNTTVLLSEAKELLTKYPQLHPQSVVVFLHSPHCSRTSETVTKKFTEQVIANATVTALVSSISKPDTKGMTLVHEYVSRYTVNGYRVHDPRQKQGTELGVTVVHTSVPTTLYTALLTPLQAVFQVPLIATSFVEMLIALLAADTSAASDFCIVDLTESHIELTSVRGLVPAPTVHIDTGATALLTTIQKTSEMSREDVERSIPLLASKTLEEQLAKRLSQGVRAAGATLSASITNGMQDTHPFPVPILILCPEQYAHLVDLVLIDVPFATRIHTGDMPHMAGVVGL